MHKPDQVIKSVLEKLRKRGKDILLMHDFQRHTAEAIGALFDQLKLNGYHDRQRQREDTTRV